MNIKEKEQNVLFISANDNNQNRPGVWGNIIVNFSGNTEICPAKITRHPENKTVKAGETVTLSVVAEGSEPLQYKWQKNYMDIPGSNSASYKSPPLGLLDNDAVYRCLVTNNISTAVSEEAIITVVKDSSSNQKIDFTIICTGDRAVFADRFKVIGAGPGIIFNGNVTFGNNDTVITKINTQGNIIIGDRTKVDGDILAAGNISLGNQVSITGNVHGGQSIPYADIEALTVIPGTEDIIVSPNGTVDLLPGAYDSLHAFNNSTLVFHSGTPYQFKKFILEPDAAIGVTLQLNYNEGEKINILVEGETKISDRTHIEIIGTGAPSDFKFYSNNENVFIGTNCVLNGRIIAPNAEMDIRSNTLINGIVYAKTFLVNPDVTINSTSLFANDSNEIGSNEVLSFENSNKWSIVEGTGLLSNEFTMITEGNASMRIEGNGYQKIRSVCINTCDLDFSAGTLSYDLYIGSNQPNQWWMGETGLVFECQSAGIYYQNIGTVLITNLLKGSYNTISFTLPQNVRNAINNNHYDARFSIILNTNQGSGPYFVDNMR